MSLNNGYFKKEYVRTNESGYFNFFFKKNTMIIVKLNNNNNYLLIREFK